MGLHVDAESDGQPSLEANADDLTLSPDDEDGVTITGALMRGDGAAELDVLVTNTAGVADPDLDAWIDLNQDGDWQDAGE